MAASSAFAQTDLERATARDAANNGRAAFDAGKYEKAIDYLSRAEQLVHAPPHLLYIARAQVKLGRLVTAHETYLKITRETLAANAPKAFVSAQDAAEQEQEALDNRLPSVTVTLQGATSAPDITVQMDGTALPAAMIGIPLPADPGEHVFTASGPTIDSAPVTVKLAEAAKQTVVLKLRLNGAAPPVAAGVATAKAQPATTVAEPNPSTAATEPTSNANSAAHEGAKADSTNGHGPGLLIASMVSLGLGVASTTVGIVYMRKSSDSRDHADSLYEQCLRVMCVDQPTMDEINFADSEADRQQKIGIGTLIGGGVGILAGVTLLVVDVTRSDKSARQTTPHVTPMFGFRSVGVAGTF